MLNEGRLREFESGGIQTTGGRGGNPRVTISQVGNAYHKWLLDCETALFSIPYFGCPATVVRHLFCGLLEPHVVNPTGRRAKCRLKRRTARPPPTHAAGSTSAVACKSNPAANPAIVAHAKTPPQRARARGRRPTFSATRTTW